MEFCLQNIKSLVFGMLLALALTGVSARVEAGVRHVKQVQELNPFAADFSVRERDVLDVTRPSTGRFKVLRRVVASVAMIIGEAADTDGVKERLIRPGNPTQRH